jgi:HK97 family phage prohead protease
MQIEQRFLKLPLEVREADGKKRIAGRGVPYGEPSSDMGFTEVIEAGAFDESLREGVVKMLWAHDHAKVLGSTKNRTLILEPKADGIYFDDELPDTQDGRDAKTLIDRGDVDGVSFGFYVAEDSWNDRDKNNIIRTVKRGTLVEISPVAFPAYPQTQVSLRSLYEQRQKDKADYSAEKRKLQLMEVES